MHPLAPNPSLCESSRTLVLALVLALVLVLVLVLVLRATYPYVCVYRTIIA